MAFQPVPDTAEAVVVATQNSVIVTNTFYFKYAGAYNLENLQDLAESVDGWVGDHYLPLLGAALAYNWTHVRGLAEINDYEALSAVNAGIGGQAVQETPNSVTFAVKRYSAQTGRSARGRVYVIGVPLTAYAGNNDFFTTTFGNNIVAALNELRAVASPLGWTEVIVSRYANGAKRPLYAFTFPVVAYAATDLRVDTRRDRLPLS